MERRRDTGRGRINIPGRGESRPLFKPVEPKKEEKALPSKDDLASHRQLFGFDDIPVDDENMEQVRFRDILRAWIQQGIKHSPLEDKLKNASTRTKRLNEIKNDLKWAMQADLDEPVRPHKTKEEHQKPRPEEITATTDSKKISQPQASDSKTIDINISFGSLPKIPSVKKTYSTYIRPALSKVWKFIKTRKKIVAAIGIVVIAGMIYSGASPLIAHYTKSEQSSGAVRDSNSIQAPDYPTLLPKNTTVTELGGWKRVSPPDSNPVFAYNDKINDIQISVSQQPIPDSFKSNVANQVAELAKSFNAKNELEAGGTKMYVGTSAKGPQSVVLTKDDTLILIKSQAKVSDSAWITYVQQLNRQ